MTAGPGPRLHGLGSWRRRATGRRAGDPAGAGPVSRPAATTGTGTATTLAALTVTLGPAAACWIVAVWQMNGMDMGVLVGIGVICLIVAPAASGASRPAGCTPCQCSWDRTWPCGQRQAWRCTRWTGRTGPRAAGVTLIVAGAYEFTPLKRQFRRRCRDSAGSGFGYGLCCAGSSIGLMATLVALDVISIPWMALITIVVLAQKLLPAGAAIDVPLALAIIGLGILIILAPSSFPRSRRQCERSASRRQCARRSGRGLRLDATRAVSPQRAKLPIRCG
jgi:hypothetical protein